MLAGEYAKQGTTHNKTRTGFFFFPPLKKKKTSVDLSASLVIHLTNPAVATATHN